MDPSVKVEILRRRNLNPDEWDITDGRVIVAKTAPQPSTAPDLETVKPQQPQTTFTGALAGHAAASAIPTYAGFLGGAALPAAALALAPETGGLSLLGLGLAGAFGGSMGASALQDKVLPDSFKAQLAQQQQEHPVASTIGGFVPALAAFNPVKGIENLGVAGKALKKLVVPDAVSGRVGTYAGLPTQARNIIQNLGINEGVGLGQDIYQQSQSGQPFDYKQLALTALGNALLTEPNRFGAKLFHPSGPLEHFENPANIKEIPQVEQKAAAPIDLEKAYLHQQQPGDILEGKAKYIAPVELGQKGKGWTVKPEPNDINTFEGEGGVATELAKQAKEKQDILDEMIRNRHEMEQHRAELARQKTAFNEGIKNLYSPESPLTKEEQSITDNYAKLTPEQQADLARKQDELLKTRGIFKATPDQVIAGPNKQNIPIGEATSGQYIKDTRTAEVSKTLGKIDTTLHEGKHGFYDDLKNSTNPADRKLAERVDKAGGEEAIVKAGAYELLGRQIEGYGQKRNVMKNLLRDWKNSLSYHLGNEAAVKDYFARRYLTDAPFGQRAELRPALEKFLLNGQGAIASGNRQYQPSGAEVPKDNTQSTSVPTLHPDTRITVQHPLVEGHKGFVQVDYHDNTRSTNPDTLRKEGYNIPSTEELMRLPQGQHKLGDIAGKYSPESPLTHTPEFKKWFGESKVKDKDGNPQVVYHGTNSEDFTQFKNAKYGAFGEGSYFTSRPDLASKYAYNQGSNYGDETKEFRTGNRVYPVHLRIENPIHIDNTKGNKYVEAEVFKRLGLTHQSATKKVEKILGEKGVFTKEIINKAKKLGYDGLIINGKNGDEYVTFNPEQIKSATGNRGTFDSSNPDIRYSSESPLPKPLEEHNYKMPRNAWIAPNGDVADAGHLHDDGAKAILKAKYGIESKADDFGIASDKLKKLGYLRFVHIKDHNLFAADNEYVQKPTAAQLRTLNDATVFNDKGYYMYNNKPTETRYSPESPLPSGRNQDEGVPDKGNIVKPREERTDYKTHPENEYDPYDRPASEYTKAKGIAGQKNTKAIESTLGEASFKAAKEANKETEQRNSNADLQEENIGPTQNESEAHRKAADKAEELEAFTRPDVERHSPESPLPKAVEEAKIYTRDYWWDKDKDYAKMEEHFKQYKRDTDTDSYMQSMFDTVAANHKVDPDKLYNAVVNKIQEKYDKYSPHSPLPYMAAATDKVKVIDPKVGSAMEKMELDKSKLKATFVGTPLHEIAKIKPTKDEFSDAVTYMRDMFRDGKSNIALSTKAQDVVDILQPMMKDVAQQRKDAGLLVKDNYGNLREGSISENYMPDMLSDKALQLFTQKIHTPEAEQAIKDWVDYAKSKGAADPEKLIPAYVDALGGSRFHTVEFNALRKAEGYGIPDSLRETDPTKIITKYGRRAANDLSYWKNLQSDPYVAARLGLPKREGGKSEMEGVRSIHTHPDVQGALRYVLQDFSTKANPRVTSTVRAMTSGLLGTATGIRNTASLPGQISPYIKGMRDIKSFFTAFNHLADAREQSIKTGARSGTMDLDRYHTLENPDAYTNTMNKLAEILRKFSGRDAMEQGDRIFTFAMGKELLKNHINDPKYLEKFSLGIDKPPAEWGEAELNLAARNFVDKVQGSYDARGLPVGLVDSQYAPFFSLARWSVEKGNTIWKDVVQPAAKGEDYLPLLTYTLGTLLSGTAIRQLNELMSGKKDYTPSVQEALSEERKDYAVAAVVNLLQQGSYAGIVGDTARTLSDIFIQHEAPKGPISFPAAEFLTQTMGENLSNWMTAMENGGGFDSTVALISNIAKGSLQNYRLLQSRLSPEDTNRQNKFRDIRVFNKLEGDDVPPLNQLQGNPLDNIDKRKFKRTSDLSEAGNILPKLIERAIEDAGNDPYKLKKELDTLKQNNYQTFPKMETAPLSFTRYIKYLTDTQGADVAKERLMDYLMQNQINQAKSAMVPSL